MRQHGGAWEGAYHEGAGKRQPSQAQARNERIQQGTIWDEREKRWPQKNPFLVGELDELQQIATVPHPPVRLWPRWRAIFDIPGGLEVKRVSERRVSDGAGSSRSYIRKDGRTRHWIENLQSEGFDPGSERTLAAWMRHASRT